MLAQDARRIGSAAIMRAQAIDDGGRGSARDRAVEGEG
jgi:hypothetical protein